MKKAYIVKGKIRIIFYPTADTGNCNYSDGTGGASGPGSFDGESNGNSAVVSVNMKSSLGSASRPPNLFSMNCQTHQKLDSIPESFF